MLLLLLPTLVEVLVVVADVFAVGSDVVAVVVVVVLASNKNKVLVEKITRNWGFDLREFYSRTTFQSDLTTLGTVAQFTLR